MSKRELPRTYHADEKDGRVLPPDTTPLDYMLAVMRDPTEPNWRRDLMARLAAPYCHKRMSYEAETKKETKAKTARKAGDKTEWAGLIETGILAARTGKKGSLQGNP